MIHPKLTLDVETPLAELWQVAAIHGREEISTPWRYEVELYVHADAPMFSGDIGSVVGKPAELTVRRDAFDEDAGQERVIKGVVSAFHYLGTVPGGWNIHRYRAVMVPPLWLASLRRQSRILATSEDKTDVELVIEGLTGSDPLGAPAVLGAEKIDDGGVTGSPPKRDFVMQYEETDLDFYHRRLAKCGVYYVFRDDGDIYLCDANVSIPWIGGERTLGFRTYAGMTHSNERIVTNVGVRDSIRPEKVAVLEYNYENPNLDLFKEEQVWRQGSGVWAISGENYPDPDAGAKVAELRAEEWSCGQRMLEASTPVLELCAGRVFTLSDHPDDEFNDDWVVISAEVTAARPIDERPEIAGAIDGYQCRFQAIPKTTPFRPRRTAPEPRIAGVLCAVIDGEDDHRPNIDAEGRYHVRFLFDRSDNADGAASAPVRLMTPFGGESEGMHMPLRKGTEVLVSFVNGDVDRPVVLGTVPNALRKSTVTDINRGSTRIRSSSGVVVTVADF